jgi:MtN3 and saliva related transmembrane protein
MEDSISLSQPKLKIIYYYEKYMLVMGVLGQMLYYIQGVKIFLSESAEGVSFFAFLLGLISVSSWLVYGLLIKNKALVISSFVAVFGALIVIAGIFMYG